MTWAGSRRCRGIGAQGCSLEPRRVLPWSRVSGSSSPFATTTWGRCLPARRVRARRWRLRLRRSHSKLPSLLRPSRRFRLRFRSLRRSRPASPGRHRPHPCDELRRSGPWLCRLLRTRGLRRRPLLPHRRPRPPRRCRTRSCRAAARSCGTAAGARSCGTAAGSITATAFGACARSRDYGPRDDRSRHDGPRHDDPGTTDPGTTDPGTTDPGTTDPGTTDPGSGPAEPGADEPECVPGPGAAC